MLRLWNSFSTATEVLLTVGAAVDATDKEGRRSAEGGHEVIPVQVLSIPTTYSLLSGYSDFQFEPFGLSLVD